MPPTAARELHVIFSAAERQADRELARAALLNLKGWGIRPFDLDSAAEAVCEEFVRGMVRQGLLPEDEFNDGLILAETSLVEVPLLVTSDKHLLNIDEDALHLKFHEADLSPVHPIHPKRLLRVLR